MTDFKNIPDFIETMTSHWQGERPVPYWNTFWDQPSDTDRETHYDMWNFFKVRMQNEIRDVLLIEHLSVH